MSYNVLISERLSVLASCASVARVAATIATRYGAVRRQGKADQQVRLWWNTGGGVCGGVCFTAWLKHVRTGAQIWV